MPIENTKVDTPPYPSYATFVKFINGLKETGTPERIDKSIMSKLSGSAKSALIAGLKWLKLIDSMGVPSKELQELVDATDEFEYGQVLQRVLVNSYKFLSDGSITLSKATGSQVEQKFREYGINGSTVIKCVAFFIMAAKEADIELGPHVKIPKASNIVQSKRKVKKQVMVQTSPIDGGNEDDEIAGIPDNMAGFIKIPIPLHGMEDGAVFLPDSMTKSQWAYALKITKFLIENYRQDDEPKTAEDLA